MTSVGYAQTRTQLFVLGAAKSGTTSLSRWLDAHDGVLLSDPKEPYFFELLYERGVDDYWRVCFEPAWAGEPVVVDARHRNLYLPFVPERIEATAPDPWFLVVLRDPVARAYSHWWHWRSRGREPLEFAPAIDADLQRVRAKIDFAGPDGPAVWARNYPTLGPHYNGVESLLWRTYVDTGFYAQQIVRYFERFGRERVLVLFTEDLDGDAERTARRVEEFLDLDPVADPIDRSNVARAPSAPPRRRPRWWRGRDRGPDASSSVARTKVLLADLYAEHNRALESLLGRAVPASWTTPVGVREQGHGTGLVHREAV